MRIFKAPIWLLKWLLALVKETGSWVVFRLPGFLLPLLTLSALWLTWVLPKGISRFYLAVHQFLEGRAEMLALWAARGARHEDGWLAAVVWDFCRMLVVAGEGLLLLGVALAGLLLCYSVAAEFYYRQWQVGHWWRMRRAKANARKRGPTPAATKPTAAAAAAAARAKGMTLEGYKRIGIILAGGGAKGAYQAGALKAIYEFLEENGALDKVKMIAGTSIGSWNALFWLAGMVKLPDGSSPLETWWRSIKIPQVVCPVRYIPARQNYLLSNGPWLKSFEALFEEPEEARENLLRHCHDPEGEGSIHFYFTRSDVSEGSLNHSTNARRADRRKLPRAGSPETVKEMDAPPKDIASIREAVFSSMGLPPLFPYVPIGEKVYEDGGVIDNVPIRFAASEDCDLLFILPLNASFAEKETSQRSIIKRLVRVTNIRQGVLEREAFKALSLYNELAGIRDMLDDKKRVLKLVRTRLGELAKQSGRDEAPELEELFELMDEHIGDGEEVVDVDPRLLTAGQRAARRTHQVARAFAICPAPKLLINTVEFWKKDEAGNAFDFMYKVTKSKLNENFGELIDSDWVQMLRVDNEMNVRPLDNF